MTCEIRVLKVYKLTNGKQIGVKYWRENSPNREFNAYMPCFLGMLSRGGVILSNFSVTKTGGVKGKKCTLPVSDVLSFSQIMKRYPEKYIKFELCTPVSMGVGYGVVADVIDVRDAGRYGLDRGWVYSGSLVGDDCMLLKSMFDGDI